MKRSIIEIKTEEFPFKHDSQIQGPFIDVAVAKRYKFSPLNVLVEEVDESELVKKGVDDCVDSLLFDATNNPYVTVRAVKKVNEIETSCSTYEEFKFIAGKHGVQLGEIWVTAEMLDLKKTMKFVSKTMQLRVTGPCPIYKKFIREVISSERSDEALNNALIDFYQRKLSESETWYGVRTTQNQKITIEMIAEHQWIPPRALDPMFFKVFNDETKVRRFDWLVKTLRWFPVVKPTNEGFIAVAYHNPTYLTYTLWRFESGFDEYKFDMACKILDKYLHYDHRLVEMGRDFCTRRWDWVLRWGYMLPIATRIKLLDNIERHRYRPRWALPENKTYSNHWKILGENMLDQMTHNMRGTIMVFMDALGCTNIAANLYLAYSDVCNALIHGARIERSDI
tara:strand:- start:4751 stop:5935 length:1185 start_codon:yes stop_codon:yes gene_type:complete